MSPASTQLPLEGQAEKKKKKKILRCKLLK